MFKPLTNKYYLNKEDFHEWVLACCDTLVRQEDQIYNITKDGTTYIDITFPIRVGEIPNMIIEVNKIVQDNEQKIVVTRNLEDKENE